MAWRTGLPHGMVSPSEPAPRAPAGGRTVTIVSVRAVVRAWMVKRGRVSARTRSNCRVGVARPGPARLQYASFHFGAEPAVSAPDQSRTSLLS